MNPPYRAVVLPITAMTQIHALGRMRKSLPMKPRQALLNSYDYKRHGITTLFAIPDILNGRVVELHFECHRSRELIEQVNAAVPAGHDITPSWTTTPPTSTEPSGNGC